VTQGPLGPLVIQGNVVADIRYTAFQAHGLSWTCTFNHPRHFRHMVYLRTAPLIIPY